MSIAGASKLLDRAAAAGLLIEITQRRSWRLFLTPDMALAFGYARPKRGRPAKEPPALPVSRYLAMAFDAFDQGIANIDRLLHETAPSYANQTNRSEKRGGGKEWVRQVKNR